jgi:hypothetical protein
MHRLRCHPPNSANEPDMPFFTVMRSVIHGAWHLMQLPRTHLCRCHAPFAVPATQFGQRVGCAVSYGDAFCNTRCLAPHAGTSCSDVVADPVGNTSPGATHRLRCHPPFVVPSTGESTGCLAPNSASEPDMRLLRGGRIACRCHPAWIVNMSRGRWFGRCCCLLTTSGNRGEELRWLAPGG